MLNNGHIVVSMHISYGIVAYLVIVLTDQGDFCIALRDAVNCHITRNGAFSLSLFGQNCKLKGVESVDDAVTFRFDISGVNAGLVEAEETSGPGPMTRDTAMGKAWAGDDGRSYAIGIHEMFCE